MLTRIALPTLLATACAIALSGCQATATPPSGIAVAQETNGAGIPAPAAGTLAAPRITEAYARLVARNTYFWAWPMVNAYNRRLAFSKVTSTTRLGPLLVAPINHLGMLTDYVPPDERVVACPNQDVVYGVGVAALDRSPVVIQVPDFGSRFWVIQAADLRTDSVARLGSMYGTKPGFYLLTGPDWNGKIPPGITNVFRSSTNTTLVFPRVFQDDTAEDKRAIQPVLQRISMYPLAEYDGVQKIIDWNQVEQRDAPAAQREETRWVSPQKFFDELPLVFKDAPPRAGEQARYAEALAVINAARDNPALKAAMIDAATQAETELIDPLLKFRNYGRRLPYNWTTIDDGGQFGFDYFTRTAVARSNMFVNVPNETRYFYQDLDAAGSRLRGTQHYTVTFAKNELPPVKGFWSLTLYDEQHFFVPNAIGRYSVGTKNQDLKLNADGSLTIYVQRDPPADAAKRTNWLPAPPDENFSLYLRAYWPSAAIADGKWTPPAVVAAN